MQVFGHLASRDCRILHFNIIMFIFRFDFLWCFIIFLFSIELNDAFFCLLMKSCQTLFVTFVVVERKIRTNKISYLKNFNLGIRVSKTSSGSFGSSLNQYFRKHFLIQEELTLFQKLNSFPICRKS